MNPNEIQYWKEQIRQAKEKKDKALAIFDVALDYVKGDQYTNDQIADANSKDKRLTVVNLVKAWWRIVLSTLYYRNPKITVKKSGNGTDLGARILQAVANYYVKELNLERLNKDIIGTALLSPVAAYKIGYNTVIGEEQVTEPGADFLSEQLPTLAKLMGHIPKPVVTKVNEFIKAESIFSYDIDPKDLLVDPNATSIYDARWLCHILHKRAMDVFNSTMYYNKDMIIPLRKLKAGQDDEANDEIIDLYEFHIKEQDEKGDDKIRVLVLTDSSPKEHRNSFSPYLIDGFNIDVLQFNKVKDGEFYPQSLFKDIKPIQDNKNLVRSNMMTLIDKFFARVLYDKNKVKDTTALKDGGVGALVATDGPPANSVEVALQNVFPADLYKLEGQTDLDFTIVSAVTQSKLIGISGAKTLGEAQIGEGGANVSLDDLSNDVDKFLERQAKKMIQIIKTMVPLETIMKICEKMDAQGVKTVQDWRQLTQKEIDADYDTSIEIGSSRPPNLEVKRKQDMEWLQLLISVKQSGITKDEGTQVNVSPMLKTMIYDADLENADEILVSNSDVLMSPELLMILQTPQMQALITNPETRQLFNPKLLAMLEDAAREQAAQQQQAQGQPGAQTDAGMKPPSNPDSSRPEKIKQNIQKKVRPQARGGV